MNTLKKNITDHVPSKQKNILKNISRMLLLGLE